MESSTPKPDVDRYVIVEYLAEGGMGAIYLGKKVGMGGFEKEVVLKQLLPEFTSQPEFIDLFLREAKLSASLDHANIVHTIDLVAAGNDYFIVMEYVRGGDLRALLKRVKRRHETLSPAAALFIAREVLNALTYAHTKKAPSGEPLNLIHRDISPSNIMASAAGEVKLADFGIAKVSTHKSVFYRVKGKVGYMSPEQAYAKQPIDHRSDLYSLGICLYEMLTNERLYVADLLTTPEQIYSQKVPKLGDRPGMPRGLDEVMQRALSFDPDGRYQTAELFQEALVQLSYDNGLVFTAPDLSAELRQKCGQDPTYWNTEEELDEDDDHPGTEVLGAEPSEALSGIELTSVLTGVQTHQRSLPSATPKSPIRVSGEIDTHSPQTTPAQVFSRAAANTNKSDARSYPSDAKTRRLKVDGLPFAQTHLASERVAVEHGELFDASDVNEDDEGASFDTEDEPTEHWIDARQRADAYAALEAQMTQSLGYEEPLQSKPTMTIGADNDPATRIASVSAQPDGDPTALDVQQTRAIDPHRRHREPVTDRSRTRENVPSGLLDSTPEARAPNPRDYAYRTSSPRTDPVPLESPDVAVVVDSPALSEENIEAASVPRALVEKARQSGVRKTGSRDRLELPKASAFTGPEGSASPSRKTRNGRSGKPQRRPSKDPLDATMRVSAQQRTSRIQQLAMLLAAAGLLVLSLIIVIVIGFSGPDLGKQARKRDGGAKDVLVAAKAEIKAPLKVAGLRLHIKSRPSGASVFLDRVKQDCVTTCIVEGLKKGQVYLLSVRKPGYVQWSKLLRAHRTQLSVDAALRKEPEASTGYLVLQVSPSANVTINDKLLGHVSSEGRIPLPPGQHQIQLARPGIERLVRFRVEIKAGRTTSVQKRLR
jgi:serine/threonine protein kinase